MKIDDLYDIEIQGNVKIKKIVEDDVVEVYSSEYGFGFGNTIEPYLDKEIIYMYAEENTLIIEYREES